MDVWFEFFNKLSARISNNLLEIKDGFSIINLADDFTISSSSSVVFKLWFKMEYFLSISYYSPVKNVVNSWIL